MGLGFMADSVPGVTNTMSTQQAQTVGQSVTANPVINLNTGGSALASPQTAPYVVAGAGALLLLGLGWMLLK